MIWVHVITWLVLLIAVSIVMFSDKWTMPLEMLSRLCYIILIITGIFLVHFAWGRDPIFTIVKVVLALFVICLIEMAFAFKAKGELTDFVKWVVIIGIIIVGICGLCLAGFRPFIHYM